MKLKPCRDCGALLPPDARGCPHCARNIEAERMLAKVFWCALAPALVIVIAAAAYLFHAGR